MLTLEQVKSKSAAKIATLKEPLKTAASILLEEAYKIGIMVIITEALRTIEYQNKLYAQGRTTAGSIVTNARGGYSNHNFGYAFDFALIGPNGKSILWDTKRSDNDNPKADWMEVVAIGKKLGLEWGGDWKFVDMPHFQMTFGLSTAQYRAGKRPSDVQVKATLDKMRAAFKKKDPEPVDVPTIVQVQENGAAIRSEEGTGMIFEGNVYVRLTLLARMLNVQSNSIWDNTHKKAYFNGREIKTAKLYEGRVYIPARPIIQAYGGSIEWDRKTSFVNIIKEAKQ